MRSSARNPGAIDISEACDAFLRGDTTISMGIVADLKVNQTFHMGDTVNVGKAPIDLELRVAAPSWVAPRKALVYLNGVAVETREVSSVAGRTTDLDLRFKLAAPRHDAWLVCVVLGDPVTDPAWATEEAYTFAATNPVYLDADGDGSCQSPRSTAAGLIETLNAKDADVLEAALKQADGICVQMIAEAREQTAEDALKEFDERVRKAFAGRAILKEFLRYLPTAK